MLFPWLHEDTIEAKARILLQRAFGSTLDRTQPVDLDGIIEHLSETEELIYVDDADLGCDNGEVVLGKTQPLRRRILLSPTLKLDDGSGRARFTLAHEIGHWVLHRPLFVAEAEALSLFDAAASAIDAFEFVGLNRSIFPAGARCGIRREEWQANRFAIALLIDADALRSEFIARFGSPMIARATNAWRYRSSTLRAHSRLLAGAQAEGHEPLQTVFALSTEAMAIALETRGYAVEVAPVL